MGRGRKRLLFCGGTEKGKSTQIEKLVLHWCNKYKEPCIILDPNRQARWFPYPAINFELFKGLTKGIYRINTDEYRKFFDIAFNYYRHGIIVAEDASNFLTSQKDEVIFPNLVALRHPDHDVDIVFTTHSISETPKYIFRQLNEVILFKTGDTWEDAETRIPDDKKEEFRTKFKIVNEHEDNFHFERIILQKTGTK